MKRPADAARLALGAVTLTRPDLVLRAVGTPDENRVRGTVRLLGARYVVQGVLGSLVQRPWMRVADTGVDVVHALSMVGFATLLPQHRRLAILSAVTALGFAALDWREVGR